MKIGILLENPIQVGGGFNQAINAIVQLQRIIGKQHEVVAFTTIKANLQHLKRLGVPAEYLPAAGRLSRIALAVLRRLSRKEIGKAWMANKIENALLEAGMDLAYFVTHSSTPNYFRKLNYITTVLDLCHRDDLEFPEVSSDGKFEERERHFSTCLPRAVAVMVASHQLLKSIVVRYGIDEERMIAMPFEPSPFLGEAHSIDRTAVLGNYGLRDGYYFYPAQFWPHKNHIRILEAVSLLKQKTAVNSDIRVVFSGADRGNLARIKQQAQRLGVSDNVTFLGFVPVDHMRALYEGALAVVMSTYFGPTNLPPLEAWAVGRPLVYSAHLNEQVGDAALFADANDAEQWADAMLRIRDPAVAVDLIEKGRKQLKAIDTERLEAETLFAHRLEQFAQRRKCWE
ncbi:glycosyltransferase family 4 protein [Rhizobium ruizarguesonis]|jgi:glycosyltransferase involved in cell wall biosynthesis|uniref:glycosyltransferase family 4 protein n=1 Tax=Rhizobium ruizarguesonis TaxID=2081791 RepID=UPI0010300F23|nr:glycosyltransferase family 1 protein [Rhizobium ruizarguesonis]MBY5806073.1 glycosyltransferase family 4 protein [Rhizobium leguminosarum]NKL16314.1 glycosyltransferase [Rhizobium leguminosarum bv. viciae]MBY5846889.1 glycosyltransferase family 4 protein [Rhizobium leguminosarum]MBY5894653.1 glycosyltransferase family 4 protein [Rhizobium leguminosarum]NEH87962.1 glycosyltransferase [Rhizobium ruizarguesonis]